MQLCSYRWEYCETLVTISIHINGFFSCIIESCALKHPYGHMPILRLKIVTLLKVKWSWKININSCTSTNPHKPKWGKFTSKVNQNTFFIGQCSGIFKTFLATGTNHTSFSMNWHRFSWSMESGLETHVFSFCSNAWNRA